MTQVCKEHYDFFSYVKLTRWNSYYQQIREILEAGGNEVLLIGVGDGFVPHMIHYINPKLKVTTADYDETLQPDVITDILCLSENIQQKYDVVVCCQLLEHLEFKFFNDCLKQLQRSLKPNGTLILSLPDRGGIFSFQLKIGKLINIVRYRRYCRRNKDFVFKGEHYWEINAAPKYKYKVVYQKISEHFNVIKSFEAQNNSYHQFFICVPK